MVSPIRAVVFDMIHTVLDIEPLRVRLENLGLPPHALERWFALTLRDGFALAATGDHRPFADVAGAALRLLLGEVGCEPSEAQEREVLEGFGALPLHPDTGPAWEWLRERQIPVLALTNGGQAATEASLHKAGVHELVTRVISADEVGRWKPHAAVYEYTARAVRAAPDTLALVAAHSWDVHGAKRAGWRAGWIRRHESFANPVFAAPDATATDMDSLCRLLLA